MEAEGIETTGEGDFVVVGAFGEGFGGEVVEAGGFGGGVGEVVYSAGGDVDPSI